LSKKVTSIIFLLISYHDLVLKEEAYLNLKRKV